MSSKKSEAPFIAATPASIFGEVAPEVIENPDVSMLDLPGYSEKRAAIDVALRDGESVEALPYRFHCVRWKGDQRRTAEFRAKGYRPVKWDECVDAEGNVKSNDFGVDLTGMPAAERAPDGTVLCGDLQLMVIDREGAAKIAYQHDRQVRADMEIAEDRMQEAAQRVGTTAEVGTQDRSVAVEGTPNPS